VEFAGAETLANVFEKSQEGEAGEDAGFSSPAASDVVDLTAPPYADPSLVPTELPVRTPGSSFVDSDDEAPSVSPGEGASFIKTRLAAYDRGRRSAEAAGEVSRIGDEDDDEEGHR
jgi:hypothetical protein